MPENHASARVVTRHATESRIGVGPGGVTTLLANGILTAAEARWYLSSAAWTAPMPVGIETCRTSRCGCTDVVAAAGTRLRLLDRNRSCRDLAVAACTSLWLQQCRCGCMDIAVAACISR